MNIYLLYDIINSYDHIVNYFIIKEQTVAVNGKLINNILIRLWVDDNFDVYNTTMALIDESLQRKISCIEYHIDDIIQYEFIYI